MVLHLQLPIIPQKPFLLQSRVIPWQADEQDNVSGNQSGGCHLLYCLPYSGWKHQMR